MKSIEDAEQLCLVPDGAHQQRLVRRSTPTLVDNLKASQAVCPAVRNSTSHTHLIDGRVASRTVIFGSRVRFHVVIIGRHTPEGIPRDWVYYGDTGRMRVRRTARCWRV